MFLYGLDSLKVTLLSLLQYQVINPASNHFNSNSKLKPSIFIFKIARRFLMMYIQLLIDIALE